MNGHRLRSMALVTLWIIAMVATSGCAPARVLTRDEIREKFGTLGVVADRAEAIQGGFRRPMTSRREAMEAASSSFGHKFAREVVGDPRAILVLPLLPIVGIVGVVTSAIYGAAAAESPDAVEAGAAALHRTVAALDVSQRLSDSLIAQLAKRGSYYDVVAYDPAMGDPPGTIRTLIRLSVTSIQLAGGGVNPRLTLRVEATVSTFERDTDNTWRLRYPPGVVRGLSSSSEGPKFLGWVANDALVFKRKVAGELDDLAEKIADMLLEKPPR